MKPRQCPPCGGAHRYERERVNCLHRISTLDSMAADRERSARRQAERDQ